MGAPWVSRSRCLPRPGVIANAGAGCQSVNRRCRTSRPCPARPWRPSAGRSSDRRGRPRRSHRSFELVVGGAAADQRPQVVAAHGEEAGEELSLRGEPGPRAVAAERLRDRGDDADLAASRPCSASAGRPRRGRAASAGSTPNASSSARDDLLRGHDVVEAPAVRVPDVHVLDEAQRVAAPRKTRPAARPRRR